jgi:methionyl-tRNA synthetase
MAAERTFYVTTPIYYVNAAPHLGHAYTTIAADVMARHHRQRGDDVFFLTGTDEHGEPVADAAKAQGLEPKELADRNAERFKALAPVLNVTNDFFIRTSDPEHGRRVQEVLHRVYDNGYVHQGLYEGWYCPRCADFKVENEIEDGNRCPIHHIELVRHSEQNYFFQLSAFQERLEQLYAGRPDFVMPKVRYNEALSFIKGGLQDISLSRAQLTWGVPVPWDTSHVFYVWFDALLNYYTALGFARPGEDLTDKFWPATYHVIGKDILRFHTVFWPAMLMAADLSVPEHVFVHGYLLMDGEKMSKSLGNVLDPFEIIDRFGTDALRFYVLRDVSFGEDGSVSTIAFEQRYESELANDFGNLASRTLAMVGRYRDGVVPTAECDPELTKDFDGLADRVAELVDRVELTQALEEIWQRVRRLNRYVEEQAPWQLAKDEAKAQDLDRVLRSLAEGLRVVTVLLSPWIPTACEKLLDALGTPDASLQAARLGAGEIAATTTLEPLFPKQQQAVGER